MNEKPYIELGISPPDGYQSTKNIPLPDDWESLSKENKKIRLFELAIEYAAGYETSIWAVLMNESGEGDDN